MRPVSMFKKSMDRFKIFRKKQFFILARTIYHTCSKNNMLKWKSIFSNEKKSLYFSKEN